MPKKHAAIIGLGNDFSPSEGKGIQRYTYELHKNISSLESEFTVDAVKLAKFPIIGYGLSFSLKTIFVDFSKYDLVHNPEPVAFLKPKFMLDNCKLVSTIHDFQPLLYPELSFDHAKTIRERIWIKAVIKNGLVYAFKSDSIIADTKQTKQEAISLGCDKNKIAVVNLGIDNRFIFSKAFKKARNNKIFTVGYLGSMGKRKNVEFAVKAANNIKDSDIRLLIYGKKEGEYEYLKSISKNSTTFFEGPAKEDKLISTYDSFDAFIFPSFHEGFGLPILEAQSRGLPVIIYKKAHISEEVRQHCIEAEDPDHAAQIIKDLKENGYNEKKRKEATEYARSFTWERTARETLKIYCKTIS